jgi:hypothetical protein
MPAVLPRGLRGFGKRRGEGRATGFSCSSTITPSPERTRRSTADSFAWSWVLVTTLLVCGHGFLRLEEGAIQDVLGYLVDTPTLPRFWAFAQGKWFVSPT